MSNENNNQFNNEARENHDGQFGHGQKRPYNRPKNYKYKTTAQKLLWKKTNAGPQGSGR